MAEDRPERPSDVNELAAWLVGEATGEREPESVEDDHETSEDSPKS